MKPPVGFARFRPWYAGAKQQGPLSFSPLDLSPLAWLTSRGSTLYDLASGGVPASVSGPVGLREDQSGNGRDATQTTLTARPTWTGDAILYDAVDDGFVATLPAISGGQIVIASPVGIWIDSLDFAGGTFAFGPDTYTGGPAGLLPLLDNTEKEIIILPTAMTSEEQANLVAYYEARGSAGLIPPIVEKLSGGDFEAGLIGTKSDGSGSVSTWAINTVAPISGAQDGRLVITTSASLRPLINFSSNLISGFEAGKKYLLEFDYKLNSGSFLFRYTIGGPVASVFGVVSDSTGKIRIIHEATATGTSFFFYFDSSVCDVQMDNISIGEVIMP